MTDDKVIQDRLNLLMYRDAFASMTLGLAKTKAIGWVPCAANPFCKFCLRGPERDTGDEEIVSPISKSGFQEFNGLQWDDKNPEQKACLIKLGVEGRLSVQSPLVMSFLDLGGAWCCS
jgi:hypothetical protein